MAATSLALETTGGGRSGFFVLVVNGQLESCEFVGVDSLYCKYVWQKGSDWMKLGGVDEAITQVAQRGDGPDPIFAWNFPLDAAFRATNAFGWPKLLLTVYGLDGIGRDVVRGYGWTHVPMQPGRHVVYLPLFAPMSSSRFQHALAVVNGMLPEFKDSQFVGKSDGREITRTRSDGTVKVVFNVTTKSMSDLGYSV